MGSDYSQLVSLGELDRERIEYLSESTGLSIEGFEETLSSEPIIEIGREDRDDDIGEFQAGAVSVIDPCPFCGDRHVHGFDDEAEGRGQAMPRVPHCDECDAEDYWLVWFGKGEGEWVGDPNYRQEPELGD